MLKNIKLVNIGGNSFGKKVKLDFQKIGQVRRPQESGVRGIGKSL